MTALRMGPRRGLLWHAALIHRLSGLGLAAFLPAHFLTLGLAIEGEAALDGALRWSDMGAVKFAEGALVFLLVVHLLGGLRLLAIENFAWRDNQARLATAAAGLAAVAAFVFLVRVL